MCVWVILENVQQPFCKNMLQTCHVWYNWNLLYQHEVSNWKVQQNKRGTTTREPNLRSQGIHSYSLDIFSPMNLNSRDTDYILIHLYTFKYSKFYKLLVTILCSIADTLKHSNQYGRKESRVWNQCYCWYNQYQCCHQPQDNILFAI